MKRYLKRSCAVVLSVLMAASIPGCSTKDTKEDIPALMEPQNLEVTTVKVERADVRVYKVETTRVEPKGEEVYFAMDGTVEQVFVQQGQYVEKGTLLAQLSAEEYEEKIPQTEKEIEDLLKAYDKENAKAAKQAKEIEDKIARLKREVRSSGGDLRNQKRTELEIAQIEQERFNVDNEIRIQNHQNREAKLREKLAELEEMKTSSKLYSPYDGYVLNQPLNLIGQRFHEEDAAFVIYDASQLYVTADYYSEARFEKMHEHYALIDGEKVELEFVELTEEQLKQLSVKSTPGSSVSKRVQYRLALKEGQTVNFGDYALVIFVTDSREDVLTLPTDLVSYDGFGYHVYKYEDGVRKQVEIIPGLRDNCRIEIISGLEEGDVVYAQH